MIKGTEKYAKQGYNMVDDDMIEDMVNGCKFEFIGNTVHVDVDGLRGVDHYTVDAAYNRIFPDGHADLSFCRIDEFDYSWDDIQRDGGVVAINQDLRDVYGPDPFHK